MRPAAPIRTRIIEPHGTARRGAAVDCIHKRSPSFGIVWILEACVWVAAIAAAIIIPCL
jgi:hypothetical protein